MHRGAHHNHLLSHVMDLDSVDGDRYATSVPRTPMRGAPVTPTGGEEVPGHVGGGHDGGHPGHPAPAARPGLVGGVHPGHAAHRPRPSRPGSRRGLAQLAFRAIDQWFDDQFAQQASDPAVQMPTDELRLHEIYGLLDAAFLKGVRIAMFMVHNPPGQDRPYQAVQDHLQAMWPMLLQTFEDAVNKVCVTNMDAILTLTERTFGPWFEKQNALSRAFTELMASLFVFQEPLFRAPWPTDFFADRQAGHVAPPSPVRMRPADVARRPDGEPGSSSEPPGKRQRTMEQHVRRVVAARVASASSAIALEEIASMGSGAATGSRTCSRSPSRTNNTEISPSSGSSPSTNMLEPMTIPLRDAWI